MKYDENFEILWNFWVLKFCIIFFYFKILKFNFFGGKFWPPTDGISTHGISTPLPMVFWPPYPWYIDPPTHGILTPYPWYIDPPTHGILTPLPMVYRPPYPWYFDPPTHGILNPLPMVFWPPYPWYIDPLSMVFWPPHLIEYRPPYTWYFDLPAYLLIRNGGFKIPWGFNLPYRGGSVFNKGVQYTMDVNRPRCHMVFWTPW